jgi:hypothetical protein
VPLTGKLLQVGVTTSPPTALQADRMRFVSKPKHFSQRGGALPTGAGGPLGEPALTVVASSGESEHLRWSSAFAGSMREARRDSQRDAATAEGSENGSCTKNRTQGLPRSSGASSVR